MNVLVELIKLPISTAREGVSEGKVQSLGRLEHAFQAGVNRLEALQELMLRALAVWLIFAALWAVLPT